ncbi:MAG: PilX N-terminal domain-containing pilus assembly protein [Anderseniella sp.]|jgi:Tfp pilus assembly protein PilX|nr:PilX N-terminal domain-containing pilus assembly protein [Anderseniella sp.]
MNRTIPRQRQRGISLVIGLILLVLITLVVTSAFMLSSTNLKAVGNMQYRDEAIAAANAAIEQVISSDAIFLNPVSQPVVVGNYTVQVAAPVCLYAVDVNTGTSNDQNPNILIEGVGGGGGGGGAFQDTYWDIAATVNDGLMGAAVVTHQGIKITLPAAPNPCP